MSTVFYHTRPLKVFFVLILLFISCTPSQRENKPSEPIKSTNEAITPSERSASYNPSEALWAYEYNSQGEAEIKQLRPFNSDTLTGYTLEKIINNTWPRVQIKFLGTSGDTAFISIPQSKVLTQQMGSAGAESFMISTTWSFSELKGINHLSFSFEEGDHAVPGVYDRNSFHNLQ